MTIERDVFILHPSMLGKVRLLIENLDVLHHRGETHEWRVFETYRSPQRQRDLYNQGRTTAGKKVTNARPWASPHQYGLALDIVGVDGHGWSWDNELDWPILKREAERLGLGVPIEWDRAHVEAPWWQKLKNLTF